MMSRTAKSCGPDAPTLVSSFVEACRPYRARTFHIRKTTVAKEPGHRGARHTPLKPLRAGMPGDSGVLVVTRALLPLQSAHEAAGAAGTRHSPRPLFSRGRKINAQLGRTASREREVASVIRAPSLRAKRPRLRHSGAMRSIEPGISRFRVWSCGPSRNDGYGLRAV
jgi:hypothetical protein